MHRITRGRILKVDLAAFPNEPLHRRIYFSIRNDIVDGLLSPGLDLPSTRRLAVDLCVARGTVVIAYEQLRAEGYLDADVGKGTRVTSNIPDLCLRARDEGPRIQSRRRARCGSRRGQAAVEQLAELPSDLLRAAAPRAFRSMPPAIDLFPIDVWMRMASRQWRKATTKDLSYGDPMGYLPLRRTIAEYVGCTRGVRCNAEQIMVVAGAQQGMDIAVRALVNPGEDVCMEDPGYIGIRGVLHASDARMIHVGVDHEGIDVAEGRRLAPSPRMMFVTPAHQVPLGMPLSAARRRELVQWALDSGAWIFEDDYNSDFQYATQPTAALQAGDHGDQVVYCGTFNKSLFPGLRIGFLVVPKSVLPEFKAIRHFSDIQQSHIDQATLAAFIAEGHYDRHIRKLRSVYHARRQLLIEALEQCSRWLSPTKYDSGRELVVWLNSRLDDVAVAQAAERAGITVMPLTPWSVSHRLPPALRLGYSGIDERDIRMGVKGLARVLDSLGQGLRHRSGQLYVAS